MFYENINELLKNRVFYHFSKICEIPHQSYFEKDISDFILSWAKSLGLEAYQDEKFNLLIRKPATHGYENKKPVILQAHIDMVCEKRPEVEHDFKKDSIKIQLDGDILSTGNRTTLGADNGIGVSMAMAVLEDNKLKHPPIDVIFTTAEEEDMSGALNVSSSWFHTNRVINLDNTIDTELIAGSSGGKGAEIKFLAEYIDIPKNYTGYKIKIGSLVGGHSGEDIHRGRASANILLARILDNLRAKLEFMIYDINAGNFRLAISREAYVILAIDKEKENILKSSILEFEKEIKKVYEETEKNLLIETEEISLSKNLLSKQTTDKIIDAIILSPNGIHEMLGNLGVVESSCNLGEVYIKDGYVYLITEIRGTFEYNIEYIYSKIVLLAKYIGAEVRDFAKYPSWIYKSHSDLRNLANKVYFDMFGEEIKTLVLHAGLECGCFVDKVDDMDAISIGPNAWDLHSPKERVSVSSTDKIYKYLVELLEKLD